MTNYTVRHKNGKNIIRTRSSSVASEVAAAHPLYTAFVECEACDGQGEFRTSYSGKNFVGCHHCGGEGELPALAPADRNTT